MTDTLTPTTNWAGNVTFSARAVHRPTSLDEVRWFVTGAERVRALGSGHSFSTVADTDGDLVLLDRLPKDVVVDPTAGTVTVSGGCTYGDVVGPLHQAGLALPSMGSLPHISVAGAMSTGTHGSGDGNRVLAASAVAVQLVGATGDLLELDRSDARFDGALVALGTLGIVTRVTLSTVPGYQLVQQVQDRIPVDALVTAVDEVLAAGYSVSAFTSWAPGSTAEVWVKRTPSSPAPVDGWLGGVVADGPRHPVPGMPTEHATQQMGEVGPWHERLPHFRMEFTPSSGDELQTEYLLPREHAAAAAAAVAALGDRIAPVLQIGEIRSVAADDLWLSSAYGRDSLALHFTWVPDLDAVLPVLAEVEAAIAPFDARPHWGKVFTTAPEVVRSLYPRLPDFVALRDDLDPDRRFANAFVDRYLGT
ncbi:D-arabinono-1,4-lactone oxidase [Aquipuribacter sp. MA13-6]|uniref:D-arabinono-1,4-lactone oxidase n=1 Tax=unclassified Aquipuribacter TaxID=2635084 RepID=UPI003EF081C9